tara:strand:- start:492 stop:2561 length:2070 start_codon:yes stop_codon:yes gene_type:complete
MWKGKVSLSEIRRCVQTKTLLKPDNKRHFNTGMESNRTIAATNIQKVVRGNVDRDMIRKTNRAATNIQKVVRGNVDRDNISMIRKTNVVRDYLAKEFNTNMFNLSKNLFALANIYQQLGDRNKVLDCLFDIQQYLRFSIDSFSNSDVLTASTSMSAVPIVSSSISLDLLKLVDTYLDMDDRSSAVYLLNNLASFRRNDRGINFLLEFKNKLEDVSEEDIYFDAKIHTIKSQLHFDKNNKETSLVSEEYEKYLERHPAVNLKFAEVYCKLEKPLIAKCILFLLKDHPDDAVRADVVNFCVQFYSADPSFFKKILEEKKQFLLDSTIRYEKVISPINNIITVLSDCLESGNAVGVRTLLCFVEPLSRMLVDLNRCYRLDMYFTGSMKMRLEKGLKNVIGVYPSDKRLTQSCKIAIKDQLRSQLLILRYLAKISDGYSELSFLSIPDDLADRINKKNIMLNWNPDSKIRNSLHDTINTIELDPYSCLRHSLVAATGVIDDFIFDEYLFSDSDTLIAFIKSCAQKRFFSDRQRAILHEIYKISIGENKSETDFQLIETVKDCNVNMELAKIFSKIRGKDYGLRLFENIRSGIEKKSKSYGVLDNLYLLYQLADTYLDCGEPKEARKIIDKAESIESRLYHPDFKGFYEKKALVYLKVGQIQKATDCLNYLKNSANGNINGKVLEILNAFLEGA